MNRIFIILGLIVAAIVAFFALAIGGGKSGNGTGSTGTDGKTPNAAGGGKVLRLAIDTEPKTLDPIGITDTISDGVARKVHNGLVRLQNEGGKLVPKPDLAEKFEISDDGKTYTFTLRKGIKFHNGREMKAADAEYSLRRLLSGESKRPDWLKPFVTGSEEFYKDNKTSTPLGIKATDDYTLTITLTQPFAPFIQHLCTSNCAVVPREAVENTTKPFARNPVGVGAFRLADWKSNEVLVFARNDEYFRGRPKLDEIRFFIIKEPNTRLEKFFGGELDASDIPYGRMKEARGRATAANMLEFSTFRTNYIGFGFPNGKFTDKADVKPWGVKKEIRQAISYALDRDYLCDKVLEGRGIPARGVLPPGMPGFKEGRSGWPKDLAKAKKLLADAGFPDGKGLPALTILHRNDENTKKIAQTIIHDLEQIGINCELQAREWNSFLEMVELEPRTCFLLGWVADYPDPDNFLNVLFNSKNFGAPGNHTWYANKQVDELTDSARNLIDMKERAPLYEKAEDIILDECPWICTYHVKNVILLRKEVTFIRDNWTPLDTGTEFPQVDFAFVDVQ